MNIEVSEELRSKIPKWCKPIRLGNPKYGEYYLNEELDGLITIQKAISSNGRYAIIVEVKAKNKINEK